jgi:outer membrane biosynthesis protein TonB
MVVEPAYPPNSLGEGGVVLRLELSESGSISKVKVVQGLGDLTGSCVSAVSQWKFAPAYSGTGKSLASEAYAVFVLRRPVLSK